MNMTTGEDTRCCTEECGKRINAQTPPSFRGVIRVTSLGLIRKDSSWDCTLKEGESPFSGVSYAYYKKSPFLSAVAPGSMTQNT